MKNKRDKSQTTAAARNFRTWPGIILLLMAGTMTTRLLAQSTNEASAVVATGAKLEKLAGEFTFTEGPKTPWS